MPEIILEYEDGRSVRVERHLNGLSEGLAFALDLADRAGHYTDDGHGPPKYVKVYFGGLLELTISVIPGGLFKSSNTRQSRPT